MTEHLPFLSEKYGLLPWHLGGPEVLTYKEIESYIEHYRKSVEAEKKELTKPKTSTPRTPRPRR